MNFSSLVPFVQALIENGAGAFIALVILVGIFHLANKFGTQLIANQREQIKATTALAESILPITQRDGRYQQETSIALQVQAKYIEDIMQSNKQASESVVGFNQNIKNLMRQVDSIKKAQDNEAKHAC